MRLIRLFNIAGAAAIVTGLAACAPTGRLAAPAAEQQIPSCSPAGADDVLVGNWLSVSAQKGVAGSVRTLYTLNADGTMSYVEQVKRPRTPSQGLEESGCWSHQGAELILRTLESNGLQVNLDDPIYTNRYRVKLTNATELRLQGTHGDIRAKRMSPGYRLPF